MFFFFFHLVLKNRVLIFQVQGSCVVLDARRLVRHTRTNVLDHLFDCCLLGSRQDFCLLTPFDMIAQLRETLAYLRSDHNTLCLLLIKEGVISAKGVAQEKHLQRVAVTCRVWPSTFVFDINDVALAASRFMTRDDHAALRTSSKHMSQCMSATSSAVIPSKILVADLEGPTELFDTTSSRWETLSSVREGPLTFNVSRDPRTSLRVRRY